MDTVYREAFAEVLKVLNYADENLTNKIPNRFIDFLEENKDPNYIVKIDFTNDNWENTIKEETQAILALIYRAYIVSPEKRKELIAEETNVQQRIENEIREKYNPDNIFSKSKQEEIIEDSIVNNEVAMMKYKESIFKKIVNKFKNILHIE